MIRFSSDLLVSTLLAVVIFGALVSACGSSPGREIVFVSTNDGDSEIVSIDPDSGVTTLLTVNGSPDFAPRWSPDGKVAAYISELAGERWINLVDRKEKSVLRLAKDAGGSQTPWWSPDGGQLAFISEQDGNPEVFLVDADGSQLTRITSNSEEVHLGGWSPDGEWILFFRGGNDSDEGLWLRNPDGVNLVRLTTGPSSDPAWSPNGQSIVFVGKAEGSPDIFLAKKLRNGNWQDALEFIRLTKDQEEDRTPVWSPDGKSIVFVSSRDGNGELYTMLEDGSKQVRLTFNEAEDLTPVWSPDGKRIAFVSNFYGAGEIFVMDSNGGKQRRITDNSSEDNAPDW